MSEHLTHATLKAKQRAIRADIPETMGLRSHRAISWVGRAEACGEDDDARFVFLWIAFNAAYADEQEFQAVAPGERAAFVDYFGRLVALDEDRRIYKALWQRFSGPILCAVVSDRRQRSRPELRLRQALCSTQSTCSRRVDLEQWCKPGAGSRRC
ncbi:hypothetical protein JCM17843_30080 [Kordiimonadales bacterium JCM 17843]|uniref:hypothetical protein n=1 Tax=Iodidimonas muriae TaxID=261467 RepID=UPI00125C37D5|nr:hypothetical protein [Iodidimonas muriae]GER08698.1 hypothetical protein JCM17843_30080 [Kordiimonadales bacterium JCM 17843]